MLSSHTTNHTMHKRTAMLCLFCMLSFSLFSAAWRSHIAYNAVEQIVISDTEVYLLSGGNFYSINKQSERRHNYSLQDGLSTTPVTRLHYDKEHNALLVFHQNGYLDIMSSHGVRTIPDLYIKDMTNSKAVQCCYADGATLYLGMSFGILTYNTDDGSFVDTYYIGEEAAEVSVKSICVSNGYLYACSDSLVYRCPLNDNIVDYRQWERITSPHGDAKDCVATAGGVNFISGGKIYSIAGSSATPTAVSTGLSAVTHLTNSDGHLLVTDRTQGLFDFYISRQTAVSTALKDIAAAAYDTTNAEYWFANNSEGIARTGEALQKTYRNNSPSLNVPYRMYYYGDKLFVVQGGRWTTQYKRAPYIMTYRNGLWSNILPGQINSQTQTEIIDLMSVCADTIDPDHYYLTSYGCGVLEMQGSNVLHHWHNGNTPELYTAVDHRPAQYTRADGGVLDKQHRLWISNGTLHVLNDSQWIGFPLYTTDGSNIVLETPGEPVIDPLNDNRIAFPGVRAETGVGFLDHKGTLNNHDDDISVFHNIMLLDGTTPFTPQRVYQLTYDADGVLWLATMEGLFYINPISDLNAMPQLNRLQDFAKPTEFFLDGYEVNCLRTDRKNRLWIGTKQLGLYILSSDRQTIEEHFTTSNSPLLDNCILSIAISGTGKAMIGTSAGIVEYDENGAETGLSDDSHTLDSDDYSGMMNGWTFHFSYGRVSEVASTGQSIYGLADNSLFRLNISDETLEQVNALNGLSAANIGHIAADGKGRLLVAYKDGNFDIIRNNASVGNITDLQRKALSGKNKLLNDVVFEGNYAFLATDFGVLVLNMQKEEIAEWYMPDGEGDISLQYIMLKGDSIYACSGSTVYIASTAANLVDPHNWHSQEFSSRPDLSFRSHLQKQVSVNNCTYSASDTEGIVRQCGGTRTAFKPNGPETNSPYRITFHDDQLYMVPGGRWTTQNKKEASVMIYQNGEWTNIPQKQIREEAGRTITDYTRLAIDPLDPTHWYISAFGFGLHEWKDGHLKRYYLYGNSPLATSSTHGNIAYTRVDGVSFDSEGNIWFLNANNNNCLHVISPSGRWGQLRVNNAAAPLVLETPGDVLIDNTRESYKWIVSSRASAGVGLVNDNGTPFDPTDDRSVFRTTFAYSDSRSLTVEQVRCITQDRDGNIWIGTNTGPLMISASTDFFTSNRCIRHIINRTDGSSLGDYMLGTEQINAIAVDGGGRLWFGTAASGAFLMDINSSDNDIRTVYHFTKTNSPLPSNNVISISINPVTGEVFFGTDEGLISFRSDANEPKEDFSTAYAFPNPVRPNFDGLLTISGLVADTEVRITNAAGELVYTGKSEGGMLVWNMRMPNGKRVTPGVYRIFGNSPANTEDKKHTAIKVLIM